MKLLDLKEAKYTHNPHQVFVRYRNVYADNLMRDPDTMTWDDVQFDFTNTQ